MFVLALPKFLTKFSNFKISASLIFNKYNCFKIIHTPQFHYNPLYLNPRISKILKIPNFLQTSAGYMITLPEEKKPSSPEPSLTNAAPTE